MILTLRLTLLLLFSLSFASCTGRFQTKPFGGEALRLLEAKKATAEAAAKKKAEDEAKKKSTAKEDTKTTPSTPVEQQTSTTNTPSEPTKENPVPSPSTTSPVSPTSPAPSTTVKPAPPAPKEPTPSTSTTPTPAPPAPKQPTPPSEPQTAAPQSSEPEKPVNLEEMINKCQQMDQYQKEAFLKFRCDDDETLISDICTEKPAPKEKEPEQKEQDANDYQICERDTFDPNSKEHIANLCGAPPAHDWLEFSPFIKVMARQLTAKDELVPSILALSCQLKSKTGNKDYYPKSMDTVTGQFERFYTAQMNSKKIPGCIAEGDDFEAGPGLCPDTRKEYDDYKTKAIETMKGQADANYKACVEASKERPYPCLERRDCEVVYQRSLNYKPTFGGFLMSVNLWKYLGSDHDICGQGDECKKPVFKFESKESISQYQNHVGALLVNLEKANQQRYEKYCSADKQSKEKPASTESKTGNQNATDSSATPDLNKKNINGTHK